MCNTFHHNRDIEYIVTRDMDDSIQGFSLIEIRRGCDLFSSLKFYFVEFSSQDFN